MTASLRAYAGKVMWPRLFAVPVTLLIARS